MTPSACVLGHIVCIVFSVAGLDFQVRFNHVEKDWNITRVAIV